jgi:hypothetical protein
VGFVLSGDGDDHRSMRTGELHAFHEALLGDATPGCHGNTSASSGLPPAW